MSHPQSKSQSGGLFIGYKPYVYQKYTKRDIDTYAVSKLEKNDYGNPVDFKGHTVNRRDPNTYITFTRGDTQKSLGAITLDTLKEVVEPMMPPAEPFEHTIVHEPLKAIPIEKYTNHKKQIYIRGFVVQPGSKKIALTDTSGAVVLVNLPSLYHHGRFKVPQKLLYMPSMVAFTTDGKTMVMAQDKTVYVWDIPKKLLMKQLVLTEEAPPMEAIHSLSFRADNRRLMVGIGNTIVFLDFPSLTRIPEATITLPLSQFQPRPHLMYVPNRHRDLLVGIQGNIARVIDAQTRTATPSTSTFVMEGHSDTIQCIAIHPKGTHVATGSKDKTIRLWDISGTATPTLVRVYKRHTGGIVSLAFSPDGNFLASGSLDGSVRVWNITSHAKTELLKYMHRPLDNTIKKVDFVLIKGTLMVAVFAILDKAITLIEVGTGTRTND